MKYKKRKINIYGDPWVVHLFKSDSFKQSFGKSSCALTTFNHERGELYFFFSEDDTSMNTVTHEVLHAYFSYQCLDSVRKFKLEDMEEVFCEFVSNNLQRIIKTSKQVHRYLNGRQ